ncbi:hypothetical protein DYI21_02780 [Thalassospira tepidiphila]|nr:hypothetical protein [Thalassospira tepidiphila]
MDKLRLAMVGILGSRPINLMSMADVIFVKSKENAADRGVPRSRDLTWEFANITSVLRIHLICTVYFVVKPWKITICLRFYFAYPHKSDEPLKPN